MRSLRYLNTILTIVAVLLSLHLWTMWSVSPAGESLSLATEAQAAPEGIPNAASQRKQMIDEIKSNTRKVEELLNLFKSGQARVRLEAGPNEKK